MVSFLSELITYKSIERAGQPLLPETEALMSRILQKGDAFGFSS